MRPSGLESLRGIQVGLTEVLGPELATPFAQDASSTLQMLGESLAAEWDTAADNLRRDNATLRSLLSEFVAALQPSAHPEVSKDERGERAGNDPHSRLVTEVDEALAQPAADSVRISDLASENDRLRAALETALGFLEDEAAGEAAPALLDLRGTIFTHLREVAARGWSFWDMASFREYMARVRSVK